MPLFVGNHDAEQFNQIVVSQSRMVDPQPFQVRWQRALEELHGLGLRSGQIVLEFLEC
jgi:hypothetical protein